MTLLKDYDEFGMYDIVVRELRHFFDSRDFIEVELQSRQSILSACEDPFSISSYTFDGVKWPLPQTNQMHLEHELLRNPDVSGLYCITTSYRDEPNPDPYRHLKIFPMFEFESRGHVDDLQELLKDLCRSLGLGSYTDFRYGEYEAIAHRYGVEHIGSEEEHKIGQDYSNIFFLRHFPTWTNPFWNMKRWGNMAEKIDTILYGVETIGSAERSCDAKRMEDSFFSLNDGRYCDKLFHEFGKDRVLCELNEYLNHEFFPRFGGGIGITRLVRATVFQGSQTV